MAATAPGLPETTRETFADDLTGIGSFFMDPEAAARRIFHKWFWVLPLVSVSAVAIAVQWAMIPLVQHILEIAPVPQNATPETYQKTIQMGLLIQKISMYVTPLLVLGMTAIQAGIVLGTASVLGVKTKFLQLFNLTAGTSVIGALGAIATLIVVKFKGVPSSMSELKPPLGVDIFLPEGTNKYLLSILGYFSIFQLWLIVMFVLIFSVAFRTGKGKALAAYSPVIILSLLLGMVGAAFRPN